MALSVCLCLTGYTFVPKEGIKNPKIFWLAQLAIWYLLIQGLVIYHFTEYVKDSTFWIFCPWMMIYLGIEFNKCMTKNSVFKKLMFKPSSKYWFDNLQSKHYKFPESCTNVVWSSTKFKVNKRCFPVVFPFLNNSISNFSIVFTNKELNGRKATALS